MENSNITISDYPDLTPQQFASFQKYKGRPFLKAYSAVAFWHKHGILQEIATVQIHGSEHCNYAIITANLPTENVGRIGAGRAAGSNYNRIFAAIESAFVQMGIENTNVQSIGIERALRTLMEHIGFETFKVLEIN